MIKLVRDVEVDFQINFDLENTHNFIPKSESIKKYIDSEIDRVLDESLLEDKDVEMLSFKPSSNFILRPYFSGSTGSYNPHYNSAGFSDFFITGSSLYIEESFYLFDIYNSYSDNNQILLSRNFAKGTKVIKSGQTDIMFENKIITKEFTNVYVPTYFTYSSNTCYMKIQFFNSVNGKLRYFKCNDDPNNLLDNSKNYLEIYLDKTNYTYQIINGDILSFNPNVYKISEVIEPIKETEELNNNITSKIKPNLKTEKIITSKGKFI
jgi:hypothetical protein